MRRLSTLCGCLLLLIGSALAARAQTFAWGSPDTVVASGITPGEPDSVARLINGDTVESPGSTVYFYDSEPGVEYFEFGFAAPVDVAGIRIYNDVGADDDGVIEFQLEMLLGGTVVATEGPFIINDGPSTEIVTFTAVSGIDAVRFFVLQAQYENTRFQIREIEFDFQDAALDGDGYVAVAQGGDDCDDDDPAVHPGATETCNGIDDDCDGFTDDEDDECEPGDDDTTGDDDDASTGGCDCQSDQAAPHRLLRRSASRRWLAGSFSPLADVHAAPDREAQDRRPVPAHEPMVR